VAVYLQYYRAMPISTKNKPAALGAAPTFANQLRLVEPDTPSPDEFADELAQVFSTGILTKGPFLRRFEAALASYCGVSHAVAVSSCTSGLILGHRALKLEGEIIFPSFTFLASALGCAWTGATAVFVDANPDDWTVSPAAVEAAITSRTSAIVATHVFGNPCQVEQLQAIAEKYKLALIYDAAHGFGSLYQGKPLGAHGIFEVFSCSPTKLLQCGEGGVITTNDAALADHLSSLREYGNRGNYNLAETGLNARMPELNAIVGFHSLKKLDSIAAKRNVLAQVLKAALADIDGISWQSVALNNLSSIKDLVLRIDDKKFGISRDSLALALAKENIETRNYYDPPCHLQDYWKQNAIVSGNLVVTESLSEQCLTVPLSSKMTAETMYRIAQAIRQIHCYQAELPSQ